jgi:hypothetical protein
MRKFTLGVHWLDHDGQITGDRVNGAPCIAVRVGPPENPPAIAPYASTYALIDTGCDLSLMDPQFFARFEAPVSRRSQFHGNWGTNEASIHRMNLLLVEANQLWQAEFGETIIPRHVPYRVVLGRHFLAECRLVLDGAGQVDELTFFR